MRVLFFALLMLGSAATALAQATLRLTSVPAATPPSAVIYVAGTFNSWQPRNAAHALTPLGNGQYEITLPTNVRGAIQFKFTLGSWDTCEAAAGGGAAPNRSFTVPATGTALYEGTVPAWTANSTPSSTASPSVSVLSASFAMPQLNGRRRRIWLYLPPDYATATTKRYPVLYMHDGQNLFDNATSFSGEWGVDEALDALQQNGDHGCIVVGIDNGGGSRLNEYSPYVNPQYGGGEGDQYLAFIVQTLKPYVDSAYRTQTDRLSTGLMGSSMGGLISLYGGLKYPEVFGRVGVFSPSLWFNRAIYSYAKQARPTRPDPRFYFLSSNLESASQARDQRRMADTLSAAGFAVGTEIDTTVTADGAHSEWFWKREFPAAYRWLFAGGATGTAEDVGSRIEVYPNPATEGTVNLRLPMAVLGRPTVEVYNATGRLVRTTHLKEGKTILDVHELPPGTYLIRVLTKDRTWSRRWVK